MPNGKKGHCRLPMKVSLLRQKLAQKAKDEPKFKFYALYGHIYREDVLGTAWSLVAMNGGCPGIDGISIQSIVETKDGVSNLLTNIREELIEQTYKPQPVKRVFIPKPDGSMRPLGIPTVKDRVVQTATVLILEPIFEADFLECSYGFRPGRSAHQALDEIKQNLQKGYTEVYDADLKGYFDSIPHDKLMACLRMRIVDRSVLTLIKLWLQTPIVEPPEKKGGPSIVKKSPQGTPQGGVISPLLSNIYLHWFDKVFQGPNGPKKFANAKLIRYADDFIVMARYVGTRIRGFIEDKIESWLGLRINRDKTKVMKATDTHAKLNFLGYSFSYRCSKYNKERKYWHQCPSEKALKKFKEKIREKTGRHYNYLPIPELIKGLNNMSRGWVNYFKKGNPSQVISKIDHYMTCKVANHLKRRSQRPYKFPEGESWHSHFRKMGLKSLRDYCAKL